MRIELARSVFEWLQEASEEKIRRTISGTTENDVRKLDSMFALWAHESQLPPTSEGWRVWLLMAGRGFGKTRAGAEWVDGIASARSNLRIALVGASIADARGIMVEGVSGLLRVADNHGRRLGWEPSLGRLTWPNGSEASLFSGGHADGLRGPEHDAAWCAPTTRYDRRGGGGGTAFGIAAG